MSLMSGTRSQDGQLSEGIAGLLTFGVSVVTGVGTVLWGQGVVAGQIANPVLGGLLWPVSVVGAVILTIGTMLFAGMVLLGMIESAATPKIAGRTEYTIFGAGGMVGSLIGVAVSLTDRFVAGPLPLGALPDGVGGSITAMALVAIPATYTFYGIWRPGPPWDSRAGQQIDNPPAPEVIRQRRTKWADGVDKSVSPGPTPTLNGNEDQRRPSNSRNHLRTGVDFEELEYQWVTSTDISFDDVGGMTDLKLELERDIIKPLTSGREKAKALDIPTPNVLLHGPPGTGKTFIAKALATELGLPFAMLSGSDVQSKWINESSQKIKTLFDEAKRVAESEGGAVVFLDEIDTVLKARSGPGAQHEEDNKVTNEFLNHLQETEEHDIVFIGATNRLDAMDEAAIRSGRVDKIVRIGRPDRKAREAIIRAQLQSRPNDLDDKHIQFLAQQTEDLVGADLQSLVVDAARHSAFHRADDTIEWQDIRTVLQDA